MIQAHFRIIAINSALLLLLTAITGFMYGQVVVANLSAPDNLAAPEFVSGDIRAWNMAHLECLLNALLMLAVASVAKHLSMSRRLSLSLTWALIVCGWTNAIASTSSALTGGRGAIATGFDWNTINHLLFLIGVLAFLFVVLTLLFSALKSEH